MSAALWFFFWDAAGGVWGATSSGAATISITNSGGGGHLNPSNDKLSWDVDPSFADVREAYLRSKFTPARKPTRYRTPDNAIRQPAPQSTVQVPARASTSPQFFDVTPNIRPQQPDFSGQIEKLAALRQHVEGLTAKLKAASEPTKQPVTKKSTLSPRERKIKLAKRYASIVSRALKRVSAQTQKP